MEGVHEYLNEIRAQVEEERRLVWRLCLERDKGAVKRFDHKRDEPPAGPALWEGLAPPPPPARPSIAELTLACSRNELGDAEIFQRMHAGRFAYDYPAKTWMQYNNVVWVEDVKRNANRSVMDTAELYELAAVETQEVLDEAIAKRDAEVYDLEQKKELAEASGDKNGGKEIDAEIKRTRGEHGKLIGPLEKKKATLRGRASALRSDKRAVKVLKVSAEGERSLALSGREWDKHPLLFACSNGVVDMETGRLLKPKHTLYLRKCSPYPFIGLHEWHPFWDDHLRKVFCGNEVLIEYFEHCIGYSATGLQYNKDFWCAFGPHADNGKSATFNAILKAMGDHAGTLKVETLLDERNKSSGPDPDLMVVDGLRMGIASEAGDKARFSMERIKAITGGDEVRARGMYADSQIIESSIKLWLHTNSIPRMAGYDPGFLLRLRIIPFLAKFVRGTERPNPDDHRYPAMNQTVFRARIEQAMPYVLSWIMRCAYRFLRSPNYVTPEIVLQYTKDYVNEEDMIGQFIQQCCYVGDKEKSQSKELYKAFVRYMKDEMGMPEKKIISQNALGRDLQKREGIARIQTNPTSVYQGLRPYAEWLE